MLIRTWNLYHGNSSPPRRAAFLDQMIELATADDPDVLCVQEVPAWALSRFTVGDVAARPPLGRSAGRVVTDLHHGLLRSAVAGQGNAVQVSPRLTVLEPQPADPEPALVPDGARRAPSGLGSSTRLAWAKERRVAQAVRLRAADGRTLLVCNVHCTSSRRPPPPGRGAAARRGVRVLGRRRRRRRRAGRRFQRHDRGVARAALTRDEPSGASRRPAPASITSSCAERPPGPSGSGRRPIVSTVTSSCRIMRRWRWS